MPITDNQDRARYQVLIFRQGNEVYEETEEDLDQAVRTAKAYLDWQSDRILTANLQISPIRRIRPMFTRIVEIEAKTGKSDETISKLRSEVVPVLQKQPGFIDLIALRDNDDPQRIVCLTEEL